VLPYVTVNVRPLLPVVAAVGFARPRGTRQPHEIRREAEGERLADGDPDENGIRTQFWSPRVDLWSVIGRSESVRCEALWRSRRRCRSRTPETERLSVSAVPSASTNPGDADIDRLIVHELAHTVQQCSALMAAR
jgi:hypothetical protein